MALSMIECANAVLFNGLGRYDEALAPAQRACAQDDLSLYALALVELIEAAVRSNRPRARRHGARAPQRTNTSKRHRLGPRARGPLARVADRRPFRRTPLRGGGRAAGPRPPRPSPGPSPARVRRMAASREPTPGRARATSSRPRHVQPHRGRGVCGASPSRALGHRRDRAQTHRRHARRAHSPGGSDRTSRPRRPLQPRDRRTTVHQPPNGAVPPAQGLRRSSTSPRATSSAAFLPAASARRSRPRPFLLANTARSGRSASEPARRD